MESYCLPILMYAMESLCLPISQITEINSWWNSVFRKNFHYNKWESVRSLIYYLGRLDLIHLSNLRTMSFISKTANKSFGNHTLTSYFKLYLSSGECSTVFTKYDCQADLKFFVCKNKVYDNFRNNCSL